MAFGNIDYLVKYIQVERGCDVKTAEDTACSIMDSVDKLIDIHFDSEDSDSIYIY